VRRIFLIAALLAAAPLLLAGPSPGPRRTPSRPPAPPLDFSGVWEIDESASANVSAQMRGAVLSVTQKGNRIWISPQAPVGKGSAIMAEELIADGRPYEKFLGPAGKGTVTAQWGSDGASLWIEVQADSGENPQKGARQRSVWKLSQDRKVWVRESVSISEGTPRQARLVFRKRSADGIRTPTSRPAPRTTPARTPRAAPTP
jgi:hypothetical protein